MDASREFVKCESCGTKYMKSTIQAKIQEICGKVSVEGAVKPKKPGFAIVCGEPALIVAFNPDFALIIGNIERNCVILVLIVNIDFYSLSFPPALTVKGNINTKTAESNMLPRLPHARKRV